MTGEGNDRTVIASLQPPTNTRSKRLKIYAVRRRDFWAIHEDLKASAARSAGSAPGCSRRSPGKLGTVCLAGAWLAVATGAVVWLERGDDGELRWMGLEGSTSFTRDRSDGLR
jgi:hypothetical protein